jgi:hypothetical protein
MRLFPRKLLLAIGASSILTACANPGPPLPPSLNLPKPPTDLRATRKGSKVTLTWTIPTITTDHQIIRSLGPTLICRGSQPSLTACGTPVGEAPAETVPKTSNKKTLGKKSEGPKISESYTDLLPSTILSDDPSAYAAFAVEVLNPGRRGAGLSNQVRVSLIRTLPAPADLTPQVTAQGVVLGWTNQATPQASLQYLYRVHRREEGSTQASVVGEVPAGTERTLTFTDSAIEWQKTYEYQVDAVTIIASQGKTAIEVPGDDSAEIKVFANDTFPPAVPSGLQAVSSGPGQPPFVDLIWAPDTEPDFAGYNVYGHEQGAQPVKLNPELIKTPSYRDTGVVAGHTYFYSVSAVDIRGNESAHSEQVSETVP